MQDCWEGRVSPRVAFQMFGAWNRDSRLLRVAGAGDRLARGKGLSAPGGRLAAALCPQPEESSARQPAEQSWEAARQRQGSSPPAVPGAARPAGVQPERSLKSGSCSAASSMLKFKSSQFCVGTKAGLFK